VAALETAAANGKPDTVQTHGRLKLKLPFLSNQTQQAPTISYERNIWEQPMCMNCEYLSQ
jgi:hypothetical protein